MHFTLILQLIFLVIPFDTVRIVTNPTEEETLEKQRRNAVCCEKKMRCCNLPAPNIEIRAILTRCPNMGRDNGVVTRKLLQPAIPDNEYNIKSFQGFDEDEPLIQTELTKCRRKILLTLKIRNVGVQNCKAQFIVVDHVYDPVTEKNVRLLNPYVIKLKQEPVYKVFPLQFIDYVNSEAREQVYNKHDGNYTGCYTGKSHPTCGVVKYEGKVIPYSQGFCCSCDLKVNAQRQPDSLPGSQSDQVISYSDPAYLLDAVQCPRVYGPQKSNNSKRQMTDHDFGHTTTANTMSTKHWTYVTYDYSKEHDSQHNYLHHESSGKTKREDFAYRDESVKQKYLKMLHDFENKKNKDKYMKAIKKAHNQHEAELEETLAFENGIRKKRQTFPSGVQKRGGQNCADRYTPSHLNPETFHESTHCLRFSEVWYGIYKLGPPTVEQTVYLKVFERYEGESSATRWREITNSNKTIRVGSRYPHYHDPKDTLTINFITKSMHDTDEFAKLKARRILIPEGVRDCEIQKYPEMRNGPEEYLVVDPNLISLEGNNCDRIGVGFEGFFRQPKRCSRPRGSCLHNQPKHLWKHDHQLQRKNITGCYFLKYFANLTKTPIMENTTSGEKFLQVEYRGHQMSILDLEINADFNTVIRPQALAVITEIYVDSTCAKETILMVKVINAGLVSSSFRVQLADIPLELPDDISKVRSSLVFIPPQNQHIFTLVIRLELPVDLFHASVEVLNSNNELVALRRVRIQKFDRCICTWHCLCACIASNTGIKCRPMSLEHYHAAGFQGNLPVDTHIMHYTMLDDLLSIVFYFALFLLATLLLLGLTKAILGLCITAIGMWGLDIIYKLPKPMRQYHEKSLYREAVVYDQDGYPIHPRTKERMRNLSAPTMFCTNVVFFFIYPFVCCMIILKRLCCPYYTKQPRQKVHTQPPPKKQKEPKSTSSSTKSKGPSSQSSSKVSSKKQTEDTPRKRPRSATSMSSASSRMGGGGGTSTVTPRSTSATSSKTKSPKTKSEASVKVKEKKSSKKHQYKDIDPYDVTLNRPLLGLPNKKDNKKSKRSRST